ncbi:MAG: hypothetical protein GC192_09405 [Bacteroidetes bacterium]|nr:hypothetical protein [Bacteroidota bacterium]
MKRTLVILLVLPFLTKAVGQRTAKVTAWVELQQTDGKAVISCWCQNHSASPLHLRYQAVLIDKDSLIREGKTLALPEQPNLLLNANFLIADGQFDKIQLFIFQNETLVASSQAFGPKTETLVVAAPDQKLGSLLDQLGMDGGEIGELILDETRSKLAHDFYELFYNGWSSIEEDVKTNYAITIREQPSGIGIGTRIMVELNGEEVLQLNLQPRAEIVEELAIQLVQSLYDQIMNPDKSYQEIGTSDLSGSGIY